MIYCKNQFFENSIPHNFTLMHNLAHWQGTQQEENMLKQKIEVFNKNGVNYIIENEKKIKRFKPWIGDCFSFLYDYIMKNSIFPKKFGGDIYKHFEILNQELRGVHNKNVLELGTGSGNAVYFLNNDNQYTGTDISPGLLRRAVKRFRKANFKNAQFYVVSADDLPFEDDTFDICLCNLSLNFFSDVESVFQELKRVMLPDGIFICSVPVPERNRPKSRIRGTLYSEKRLKLLSQKHNFKFESISKENGALLYFKAFLQ